MLCLSRFAPQDLVDLAYANAQPALVVECLAVCDVDTNIIVVSVKVIRLARELSKAAAPLGEETAAAVLRSQGTIREVRP